MLVWRKVGGSWVATRNGAAPEPHHAHPHHAVAARPVVFPGLPRHTPPPMDTVSFAALRIDPSTAEGCMRLSRVLRSQFGRATALAQCDMVRACMAAIATAEGGEGGYGHWAARLVLRKTLARACDLAEALAEPGLRKRFRTWNDRAQAAQVDPPAITTAAAETELSPSPMAQPWALLSLPDDVLSLLVARLAPEDVLAFKHTSSRLMRLVTTDHPDACAAANWKSIFAARASRDNG